MSLSLTASGSAKPKGIYYDEMEKMFRAFAEREAVRENQEKSKARTKEYLSSIKGIFLNQNMKKSN